MRVDIGMKVKLGKESAAADAARNRGRLERAIKRVMRPAKGMPVDAQTGLYLKRRIERIVGHAMILGWIAEGRVFEE